VVYVGHGFRQTRSARGSFTFPREPVSAPAVAQDSPARAPSEPGRGGTRGGGRGARARREREKWSPTTWLPARVSISNRWKWPWWAWPAKFDPYQTRPQMPVWAIGVKSQTRKDLRSSRRGVSLKKHGRDPVHIGSAASEMQSCRPSHFPFTSEHLRLAK
jgi:hypothetical protein